MSDWPIYQSRKAIQAAKIVRIARDPSGNIVEGIWVRPEGALQDERFEPTVPRTAAKAAPGRYAILSSDGFKDIWSANELEEGYICRLNADRKDHAA